MTFSSEDLQRFEDHVSFDPRCMTVSAHAQLAHQRTKLLEQAERQRGEKKCSGATQQQPLLLVYYSALYTLRQVPTVVSLLCVTTKLAIIPKELCTN